MTRLTAILLIVFLAYQAPPTGTKHRSPDDAPTHESGQSDKSKNATGVAIGEQILNCKPSDQPCEGITDKSAKDSRKWVETLNAVSTAVIALFTILLFSGVVWQVRTSRDVERAWIIASPPSGDITLGFVPEAGDLRDDPGRDRTNVFSITFKNTGNTPAILIDAAVIYRRLNSLQEIPPEPDYGQRGPFGELPLVKDDTVGAFAFLQPSSMMTRPEVVQINRKEAFLVAYGVIAYKDVFRRNHETRFGYVFHIPLGGDPIPRSFRREGLPPAYNRAM